MGLSYFFWFLILTQLGVAVRGKSQEISRDDFPDSFVFGAGASSYQVEGAANEDGRAPSVWDLYTHAGKVLDKSTGDIAADQYHKYKEDVKLMSEMGLEAYRLSISWSRLLPKGRGPINPKGLEFYNNFIDELVKHGIQPHVTLYHLDFPQILEDEYKGWLSPKIVEDFTEYADVCFREFGDRVKHWTTINEPNVVAMASYESGFFPPQRCSPSVGFINCTAGNSSIEPYIVGHHTLLAHGSAARLYKERYQAKQKGQIGINLFSIWCIPYSNSTADAKATQRAIDFYIGWIFNPLVFGDYPETMKKNAAPRIPTFTKQESELLKGAFDFFALNHYLTVYIEDDSVGPVPNLRHYSSDIFVKLRVTKEDAPSGQFVPFTFPVVPSGLRELLDYLKQAYGNPPVYIQENGLGMLMNESHNDTARVEYLKEYINSTLDAIRDGSNVKGYFVWSFLDVFEYLSGYLQRYGLYHVDFNSKERTRTPKFSAHWYSNFLKKRKDVKIDKFGMNPMTNPAQ